jgi:4-amino-4-deoxy-L-arabinose transferase-like glycosyltransferase
VSGQFHQRCLWAVLISALLARLGWCLTRPATVDARLPDQFEYLQLGQNLITHHTLSFFDPRFSQHLLAYRTPGYPLLIGAMGAKPIAIRLLQALLDTFTVLAAYLLARRWLGPNWAVFAAAFVAFNPFLIYFTGLILSETLFTAMLAWGLVLLAYRPNFIWGGIVLALSIMVRPSAVMLPVLMGYLAVFVTRVRGESRRQSIFGLPVGATMLLLTGLVLAPWAIRNRAVLGEWVPLTTNSGITQYDGFNPEATGASDQSFVSYPEFRQVIGLREVERDRVFSELASRYISETWRKQPMRLVKLTLSKLARIWSPIPLSSDFGSRKLYFAAGLFYSIPLDVLVVLGLWKGRLPRSAKAFLIGPAIYFTIVHALSVGSLRYRTPLEPILAILAAAGMMWLIEVLRPQGFRRIQ